MTKDRTTSLSDPALPLERVRLEAIDGPGKGAQVQLDQGTVIAGAGAGADLLLSDSTISRRHASFELINGGVRVRDLGSRNGMTFLGARVEGVVLPIGTQLTLGRTVVRIAPLREPPMSEPGTVEGVVARSTAMRQLLWRVERVAATDATAVIRGPTGSGKEVVARALHALSARRREALEIFDCAAASSERLESDLFGHVRGAFTGATADRAGVLERANRGTLVLDNIDVLPLELQTQLLRFLQERTIRRVGGSSSRQLDVRVLATSQSVLEDAVSAGRLRPDLFYRLAQVVLELPPLSLRLEDIPVLAATFAAELSTIPVTLSKATVAALQAHPWPGNARELKNAIARGVAFGRFDAEPEPLVQAPAVDLKDARARVVKSFEADFLVALLRKHQWNVAAAARDAKLARSHLYTLISRHQLKRDDR